MLTRARKLGQVAESDAEMWRSTRSLHNSSAVAPTYASATPQPLPLPELRVLLQHDPKYSASSHCSVPLPSPEAIHVQGRERDMNRSEAVNAEGVDGPNDLKRLVGQDSMANMEHSETRQSRKSRPRQTSKEKSSDMYNTDIPISAPATPYSDLALGPMKSDTWATKYTAHPGVFQVWSAPEMPHSDGNLGLGFSCQTPPEGNASSSVDNSPLQSPRPSNHPRAMSPRRTLSPLSAKIPTENPLRRESNAQGTVHPLPLPPGANPISPVGSRSDTSGPSVSSALSPVAKSKWQKGKLIGRGTFGSVYVASNRETGALCAMKEVEILPDDIKSAECMRQLEQEIKVLRRLKHPNIVQYYGSEIVGDKFYIYLEYVHPGSINRFIHDHCGAITESVVRNFTRHILCGLAYLHSKKTIHRDIKGANLLVDSYGVVKLADFGMAKHLHGQTANLSLKGSPYWMAPELLQSAAQTDASSDIALAVDIWSLGCTIIEMMNGKPPWSECEGAAALFKVLTESPPIPNTMSAEGQDFLQCCFRRNPVERPTAIKLLDHPFVSYSHQPHACTQSLKEMKFMSPS
ncbi:hypothetical protein OROGR_006978 [Orobanche gracilis]